MGCVGEKQRPEGSYSEKAQKKGVQDSQSKKNQQPPSNLEKMSSKRKISDNFEEVQLLQNSNYQKKKLQATTSSIQKNGKKKNELTDSYTSLDELFSSNDQLQDWNSHNSTSKIFKMSKKAKNGGVSTRISKNTFDKNIDAAFNSQDEPVSAIVSKQSDNYKLKISIHQMDFEFFLPNCRAGPLVVPYINYDIYKV